MTGLFWYRRNGPPPLGLNSYSFAACASVVPFADAITTAVVMPDPAIAGGTPTGALLSPAKSYCTMVTWAGFVTPESESDHCPFEPICVPPMKLLDTVALIQSPAIPVPLIVRPENPAFGLVTKTADVTVGVASV